MRKILAIPTIAIVYVPLMLLAEPKVSSAQEGTGATPAKEAARVSSVSQSRALQNEAAQKSALIVTPDYIIGPEDVLEITVWRNQDLSREVMVRPDGRISLPLIGDVRAVGRTPAELTEVISAKLKEYKENPTVAILVRQVNSYAIYVLGEVTKPGKYPLKSRTTLLQAITIAGGFTPVAVRSRMVVFRLGVNGDGEQMIKASYDDIVLKEDSTQNIDLKPGDTLVVPSETMVLLP